MNARNETVYDIPENERIRKWGWKTVVYLLLALVLYALSVGPALWLMHKINPDRHGWPYRVTEVMYMPLAFVCVATGTDEISRKYVDLFVDSQQ